MNDEEKTFEVFRMTNILCEFMDGLKPEVMSKFYKGTRFPYFQRYSFKDDKGNRWICLYYMLSKEYKKKRAYKSLAYIVYDIPRKHKEVDVNAGRGCLIFDPYSMRDRINNVEGHRPAIITDIVPHAFNRYTERYLKPIGKENIEFGLKLESMLKRWQWFDICADMNGDENAAKHKGDSICPYDVIMRGGGMLRGNIVHELLMRINTYVSADMMFDNQLDNIDDMNHEYHRFKAKNGGII